MQYSGKGKGLVSVDVCAHGASHLEPGLMRIELYSSPLMLVLYELNC